MNSRTTPTSMPGFAEDMPSVSGQKVESRGVVTDEMVEAASRALWDHREREERRWHSYVDPGDLRDLRAEARAALEAALGGSA